MAFRAADLTPLSLSPICVAISFSAFGGEGWHTSIPNFEMRKPSSVKHSNDKKNYNIRHSISHLVLLLLIWFGLIYSNSTTTTVLYCTVLYCTVLYCTVLYCTVLYCTVLYFALLPM